MDLNDIKVENQFEAAATLFEKKDVSSSTGGTENTEKTVETVDPSKQEIVTDENKTQPESKVDENGNTVVEETNDGSFGINDLAKNIGYTFEEGEDYPETVEGLSTFVKTAAQKEASSILDNFVSQYPTLKNYISYLANGGKEEEFINATFNKPDYTKLDLKDNEEGQKYIITEALKRQGISEAIIDKKIKSYISAGILEDEALPYQQMLIDADVEHQRNMVAKQEQAKAENIKRTTQYWDTVKSTLYKSQVIEGLDIPIKEKENTFAYMAFGTKENPSVTQFDVDLYNINSNPEYASKKIVLAQLVKMLNSKDGLNLEKYITNAAKSQLAEQNKLKFRGNTQFGNSGAGLPKEQLKVNEGVRLFQEENGINGYKKEVKVDFK